MLLTVVQNMNQETIFFIVAISVLTVIFHFKYTASSAYKAPAILTTLGILGTFIGIGIGLANFNANDVQKSVPNLIDGIKTAVWVSAWGIFCAITIKIREVFWGISKRISAQKSSGATVDDLATILMSVQQALVGDDDSTLLSQIKLARTDTNDRLDRLSKSMDEFCTKVAESNSKALIEALKEVIRDFNAKINEQFGDNFKQLNQAVEKILLWQEQYRQQVTEMIEQHNIASKNMVTASERYNVLIEKAESFNSIAKSMSDLLAGIEAQKNQLNESLKLLSSLINSASVGFPEIEKKIAEMIKQVSDGVKSTNNEIKTVLLNVIQSSNQEFNNNIKQIIEKTKEQVIVLDKALSEELTKSLESLGRQLAAISQKFAQDYTPITERLNAVLKIAG